MRLVGLAPLLLMLRHLLLLLLWLLLGVMVKLVITVLQGCW